MIDLQLDKFGEVSLIFVVNHISEKRLRVDELTFLRPYCHLEMNGIYHHPYSARIDFRRQQPTFIDARL